VETRKEGFKERLKTSVDVRDIVTTRIDKLDLVRFEELLKEFIAKELRHIELLGGAMGFLIGLSQSAVFYFFMD